VRAVRHDIGTCPDLHSPHPALKLGANQIDVEKPVIQSCATHLNAFGEDKGSLELPRSYSPVQIYSLGIVRLLPTHHELVVLDRNPEVPHRKASDRKGDPQGILAKLFDIVGGISVTRNLANSIERSFEMIEPQK
jgi:hypothetical protein